MQNNRFQDENLRLTDFENEVLVECPMCKKKAVAKTNTEAKKVRLYCENCSYNKEIVAEATVFGITGNWKMAANHVFGAELWLQYPFKNDVFWSYNHEHLAYLEQYISAALREHRDRSHFTLLEKLPKFYHEAKNRDALLKIIKKLKNK